MASNMKRVRYVEGAYRFDGAISVEIEGETQKPWRVPFTKRDFFPVVAGSPTSVAACCSGVRIAFLGNARRLRLEFLPLENAVRLFDLIVNGHAAITQKVAAGEGFAEFELGEGEKRVEVWLDPGKPFTLTGLFIDESAQIHTEYTSQPRWVHYGSSISQAIAAASPSTIWTALVAARKGWNLTNLGFNGQCMFEPMVAKMIRDLLADYITLKLGINVHRGHYSERTFTPAILGFIETIREKHQHTPITVISPIWSPPRETERALPISLSLTEMRLQIEALVLLLQKHGDTNIRYIDGLQVFGPESAPFLPDELHPDAQGQHVIANALCKIL